MVNTAPAKRNYKGMVIAVMVIGQVGHMHCRCCQVNNHDCCQVLLLVILSDHLLSPHQEESSSQGEIIQRRDIQDRKYRARQYNATWVSGENKEERYTLYRIGSTGLGNIMLRGYQVIIQRRDIQDRKYRTWQYNATWV